MDEVSDTVSISIKNKGYRTQSVSIAMATYNGAKYIREQLDSLASQTLLPCELVVTDDGSSDETLKIVEDFAATAAFDVKTYRNEKRLGFADNFLKAASLCKGELIAFCDQDDRWEPAKLDVCTREFDDDDVLLCVHSATIWTNGELSNRRLPDFKNRISIMSNTANPLAVYPGFSMVVRSKVVKDFDSTSRPSNIHAPQYPMAHDQWVWFISSIFGKIVCLPDSLAFYRQHDNNVYGAGAERNLVGKLKLSLKNRSYHALSELSLECSDFVSVLAETLPDEFKRSARISASKFRQRAGFLKLRAFIFDNKSGFIERAESFGKILFSGGYLPDPSSSRLGPKAASKDILFGVSGIYKMLSEK
jgi:glycosyltransferase involved in cell wall biosynthesis